MGEGEANLWRARLSARGKVTKRSSGGAPERIEPERLSLGG